MRSEEAKNLPIITKMPIVKPETWRTLNGEWERDVEGYLLSLGADFANANPQHKEVYENALRDARFSEVPDATSATVLLVLRALDMQAKSDGYQLPQIPSPINPLPALREFIPRAQGKALKLINIGYDELIKTNPVIGEIVQDISAGAPNETLRITTETQAKRGAVYAFYGVKAVIPKQR